MELQLRFKSIARQWIVNVLLVVSLFVIIAEIILFSFIRTVYVERVRAKANEYAQDFSVLSLVPSESFYSAAREYAENFEHKDKIEIEESSEFSFNLEGLKIDGDVEYETAALAIRFDQRRFL